MAGTLLIPAEHGIPTVPSAPPPDMAVAENFEVFDGLEPLDAPAGRQRTDYYAGGPRPGQTGGGNHEYTPGPLIGVRGVVGGMPLPVEYPLTGRPPGDYTRVGARTIQWRLGVGQRGPSELGAAQTTQLGIIEANPPQPGSLDAIIGGWG